MTVERFWELIGTLGGVADDSSCASLNELLRQTGEASTFTDLLDEHVQALVEACRWPEDVAGSDAMSWVAAAVIAAGRLAYDEVLARREVDLDHWQWDEAESLLDIGFVASPETDAAGPPADHGAAVPPVGVTLQWLSVPAPGGVWTPHGRNPIVAIDLGDDQTSGRFPVHDRDWVEAQRVLAADPAFVARRVRVGHLGLFVTVRPVPRDGEPVPDAGSHSPFDGFRPVREAAVLDVETHEGPGLVLVVPVSNFPADGPRVDSYVAAVNTLVEAAHGHP